MKTFDTAEERTRLVEHAPWFGLADQDGNVRELTKGRSSPPYLSNDLQQSR